MNLLKTIGLLSGIAILVYSFGLLLKHIPIPDNFTAKPEIKSDIVKNEAALISGEEEILSKKENVVDPLLTAQSSLSVYIDNDGRQTILYENAKDEIFPIASISKLMTAVVAKETITTNEKITISANAIAQYESAGKLTQGQQFTRDELLYPLLIESSNDAAYAFAEKIGLQEFVKKMNNKAEVLGMKNTRFTNASGLDAGGGNTSTVRDIATLGIYIYNNHKDILELSKRESFHALNAEGTYNVQLVNTNQTLSDARIPLAIIGGKTGETPKAQQTLFIVTQSPNKNGYIIHVILNSTNRVDDMATLINWVHNSYNWKI